MNTMSLSIDNYVIWAILRKDKKLIDFIRIHNSYKELKKLIDTYNINRLTFDSDFLIENDTIILKDYIHSYQPIQITTRKLLDTYK